MKASELTLDLVRHAILPANMMKDQELTIRWLVLPEAVRPNRCRAADRIAPFIGSKGSPQREEALPITPATIVPPAEPSVIDEAAPVSSPTITTVEVKQDGSITVRPKSVPPAAPTTQERAELQVAVGKALKELDEPALTAEECLRAIRALHTSWKAGKYVCGNAFARMNDVESLVKRAGF